MDIFRKIITPALTILLIVIPVSSMADVRVGILGGVSRYSFTGDSPEDGAYTNQHRASFGASFEADVYDGVRLCLQPSLIQKGTGIAFEVSGMDERVDSVDVDTDYFSLPLIVKVFTPGGLWFVSSGLEFSWLMDATRTTSSGETDIRDCLDDFDLAVHFGVGWVKPIGPGEFIVEGRYTQSVLNLVSTSDPQSEFYGFRVKNSGILLCVGFLFRI